MIALTWFVLAVLASPFKSKSRLEAENAVLRHQLIVLRRKLKGRARLTNSDRWFFVQMYRCFPSILKVVTIVQPETLVSWHRAGFRRYWRWKSRRRGGRPRIEIELRALIRQMSTENFVAKYMVKRRGPPRARVGLRAGPGAVTVDSITQRLIRDRPLLAQSGHWLKRRCPKSAQQRKWPVAP